MTSHSSSAGGLVGLGVVLILVGVAIAAVPGFQNLMPAGAASLKFVGCIVVVIGAVALVIAIVKLLMSA